MTERDFEMRRAFVRDIAARPADDAPRLIYADWLMDRPDEASRNRGEFIRTSVEWAALLDAAEKAKTDTFRCRNGDCKDDACALCVRHRHALKLLSDANDWQDERPACFRPRVLEPWGLRSPVRWSRGFIAMVYSTCKDWVRWGPELAAWHPVRHVDLTNKSPVRVPVYAIAGASGGPPVALWRWAWRLGGGRKSSLPEALFRCLAAEGDRAEFDDPEAARYALMEGAARFARQVADAREAERVETEALLDELEGAA